MKHFLLFILLLLFLFPEMSGGEKGKKVVSLSPALTEIIFALGGGEDLAGRSSACDFPKEALKIPVMGDFGRPFGEKIFQSGAKFVLSNDLVNPAVTKKYRKMGIQFYMLPIENENDYLKALSFTGSLLGREKEAAQMRASFEKILSHLRKNRKKISSFSGKKALFLIWDRPLLAAGKSSLPARVLELVGLENIASHVKSEYFKASMEWILKEDPDYLFFPGISEKKIRELKSSPFWQNLRAVRENRILYSSNEELLLRPGPRWGISLLALQKNILKKEERLP